MTLRRLVEMLIALVLSNSLVWHSFTSASYNATTQIVDRKKCLPPERIDRDLAVLARQYSGCHLKFQPEVV